MLLVVALKADALGHLLHRVRGARIADMVGTRPMADLALDIAQRLLGIADAIAVRRSIPDHVTGDALRLIVAMPVQKGFERRRVCGALPLGMLLFVALLASRSTHVSPLGANRVPCERGSHAALGRFLGSDAVVERVQGPTNRWVVGDVLLQPDVLDGRTRDSTLRVEVEAGGLDAVLARGGVEDQRSPQESGIVTEVEGRTGRGWDDTRGLELARDDHVDVAGTRREPTDRRGLDLPDHDHEVRGGRERIGETDGGADGIPEPELFRGVVETPAREPSPWAIENPDDPDPKSRAPDHTRRRRDRSLRVRDIRDQERCPDSEAHLTDSLPPEDQLVHADGGRVVPHEVHGAEVESLLPARQVADFLAHVPLEKRVPGVHENQRGIFAADPPHDRGATRDAAGLVHLAAAVLEEALRVAGVGDAKAPHRRARGRIRSRLRRRERGNVCGLEVGTAAHLSLPKAVPRR